MKTHISLLSAAALFTCHAIAQQNNPIGWVGANFTSATNSGLVGLVSTYAGGYTGIKDGTGTNAGFHGPLGITSDGSGNLFVADRWNQAIRKISSAQVVSTIQRRWGVAPIAIDKEGNIYGSTPPNGLYRRATNGQVSSVSYVLPCDALATDSKGAVYSVFGIANQIWRTQFVPSSAFWSHTVIAGLSGSVGYRDGVASGAQFGCPKGLTLDALGNIFLADTGNNNIRKISTNGIVSTIAGGRPTGSGDRWPYYQPSTSGFRDGLGSAARFNRPSSIAVDSKGTLYVADLSNNAVRMIDTNGLVSTLAGGNKGYVDGVGSAAAFDVISGIALDGVGNVYVADCMNSAIRKISLKRRMTVTGYLGTLVGRTDIPSFLNGDPVTALGERSLAGQRGITNLVIPNGVTAIGSWALQGCSGIRSITIPDTVVEFGTNVFSGCQSLVSIAASTNVFNFITRNSRSLGLSNSVTRIPSPAQR